ncbi:CGNR zinc finger domain-containing protein [Kitasatospora sp. NPDC053057]|uniref:CGNR zinc finger domain-containing protein n=1 Tax=Kitasatospora sp. NPDC053057 TaxID=3364062 RepID=UPI0037C84AF6
MRASRFDRRLGLLALLAHPLPAGGQRAQHRQERESRCDERESGEQAVRLREAVDAGLRAVVGGTPFPEEAAEVINSWLARAAEHPPRLTVQDGLPTLRHTPRPADATTALTRIAVDAAELLGGEDRRRLKICTGNGCSARYYDKSPGCRRRWCSMSGCGNRAKAAQHRQRAGTS